ncbi:hypothetical protein GCM10020358_00910 [Amorphoplanes nipponensis]|uniref:Ig-like domain-containing protein n=1 Tax=Actinoplanes nipponensis TaxID=135950 RepID=A0A919JJZ8_9ACTN|nr:hypothetical protein [Actinoplanes nipponensis]GIE48159.1 hypothetical protein Ani05nite_16930 [Actinoplanes nipponensis]
MTTRGTDARIRRPLRRRWLLLLVAPALLSGCSMFTAPSATKSGGSDTTGTVTGGDQWLVVTRGSATPTPRPSTGASPAPTASTGGFLPLPAVARPTPSATCARDTPHFNKISALAVVPGPTSARVSWYNVGGYNIVEFRITAISQDLRIGEQRNVGWVTVKPGNPCGYLVATVPNLDRRTGYVFSVDAVVLRRSGDGTHAATIFRSSVVRTT